MTRTFVAVELGDDARAALACTLARLARALPGVRWVDAPRVHLTLAFLGELDDERLDAVGAAAEEAAGLARPFTLRIAGLGMFGTPVAPQVVWAGVGGDLPRLLRLQAGLADALETRGFARETRPFAPHLTLARLRDPLGAEALGRLRRIIEDARERGARSRGPAEDMLDARVPVDHLSVMKSELLRPAARYTCLRAIALGTRGEPGGDAEGSLI